MSKTITSEFLIAYSQCPRKAFLLICTQTPGTPHEYIKILEQQRQNNQRKHLDILQKKHPGVQSYSQDAFKSGSDFLINASLETNGLAAECAILTKVKTHSTLGRYSYEPTIFTKTHNIKEEQKLELFFVGHVLEQIQNKRPISGRIIGLNEKCYKVTLTNSTKILNPFLEPVQEWAVDSSPEPPSIILNEHCPTCQFQSLCRAQAKQENNLSLLDGISTPKAIKKYEKKGIFTVKQLSYTFKPRKRKKRAKNPPPITHKPELQALAIREEKIYLQELPKLTRQPVELFLDIEGVPDRQFYYLIGLLVSENDTTVYHSFWADTLEDEGQMWQQFLVKARQYPDTPIYHYGSFDPRALAKLTKRYDADSDNNLADRLINVNKHIFGKIYFPVYSNRLKEIGHFIGATWTAPDASGLQSLVWRHHWDETRRTEYRDLLLIYNQEDCQALKLLTDELSKIKYSADTLSEVDFANQPKRHATEVSGEVHSQFEAILKFASIKYDKKKISFRQDKKFNEKKEKYAKKRNERPKKKKSKATKIVQVPLSEFCRKCGNQQLRPTKLSSKRLIVDIVTTKNGIKKTVTKYVGVYGYCPKCGAVSIPSLNSKYFTNHLYNHGFKAWVVYQRVGLRLPYESITELLEEQFNERVSVGRCSQFIKDLAQYYAATEKIIIQRILESPFVHADETPINIQGTNQYVWVFTDGKYVAFKLTETREATIAHEFLVDYKGILVSDFYTGYDSVACRQQKCWVHFIRDINSDLWANPFDTEFERFVSEVRNLIILIMEAVQKYGLKKRNLNKFGNQVDKFYKTVITDKSYKSELTLKYQQRFIRYRDSLFTFIEYDDIPWHNNTAERAIRHLAIQRDISKNFHEFGARNYLVLLGIRQTCRFQDKSFFKFLFSEETDLDKFEAHKHKICTRKFE